MIAPGKGVDESLSEVRAKFIAATTNLQDREFVLLQPGKRVRFRSVYVDLAAWEMAEQKQAEAIDTMKHKLSIATAKPRLTLEEATVPQVGTSKTRRSAKVYPYPSRRTKQTSSPWG